MHWRKRGKRSLGYDIEIEFVFPNVRRGSVALEKRVLDIFDSLKPGHQPDEFDFELSHMDTLYQNQTGDRFYFYFEKKRFKKGRRGALTYALNVQSAVVRKYAGEVEKCHYGIIVEETEKKDMVWVWSLGAAIGLLVFFFLFRNLYLWLQRF